MQLSETEERIIQQACSKLKDTEIFKRVLNGDYSKSYPEADKENLPELNAYSKEAIICAIMQPIGRLFFSNKMISDVYSKDILEQFVEYAERFLGMCFSGHYSEDL